MIPSAGKAGAAAGAVDEHWRHRCPARVSISSASAKQISRSRYHFESLEAHMERAALEGVEGLITGSHAAGSLRGQTSNLTPLKFPTPRQSTESLGRRGPSPRHPKGAQCTQSRTCAHSEIWIAASGQKRLISFLRSRSPNSYLINQGKTLSKWEPGAPGLSPPAHAPRAHKPCASRPATRTSVACYFSRLAPSPSMLSATLALSTRSGRVSYDHFAIHLSRLLLDNDRALSSVMQLLAIFGRGATPRRRAALQTALHSPDSDAGEFPGLGCRTKECDLAAVGGEGREKPFRGNQDSGWSPGSSCLRTESYRALAVGTENF
ncbi:hypothetical protein BDK51DRAFT_39227 [Blyttiomyces helicus]|uniref:Uncharacterized protein n=1 Tax=Blyttiomyces helicus TaxID=388810 RepID=A0A4P9WC61_9FUNG|nr:hypothetical protein BDK51DRAFT_39227 [Blyttiomyces helicus]|eukprot:RKO88778.1 hypothetical protein BDK51DRAFT_39227 [Blyttiomyces helicus]